MTDQRSRETPSEVLRMLRDLVRAPTKDIITAGRLVYPSVGKSTIYGLIEGKTGIREEKVRAFVEACLACIRKLPPSVPLPPEQRSVDYWMKRYQNAVDARSDRPAPADAPWLRLVREHPAWQRVQSDLGPLKNHAVVVAGRLLDMNQDAAAVLEAADDPWYDSTLAERMTRWMSELILNQDDLVLSAAEAALLALAPLAHQADVLGRAARMRHVRPTDLARSERPGPDRADYERFLRPTHPRLLERADAPVIRGRRQAAREIGWWLYHQWLDSRRRTMADSPLSELFDDPAIATEPIRETLINTFRLHLLPCMGRHLDELRQQEPLGLRLESDDFTRLGRPQQVREQLVGLLIVFVHALAIEIPRLSAAIVEHLGIPEPVTLTELRATVRKATWEKDANKTLTLVASCDHEAVLEALNEHVANVDGVLYSIHGAAKHSELLRPLRRLPVRAFAGKVGPAGDRHGQPVFEIPVNRFRLDERRIRELLMDEQLYGDPALAIRELYQNALDACRYRETRREFRAKQDQMQALSDSKITFRQGVEQGRHFVECADNGVGMDEMVLRGAFSQAGVRFVDTNEYQGELAEWREAGIEFHPNSQFGIGVMSYFMLADEIEIVTSRMSRGGSPQAPTLTVVIAGPGHLFRITRTAASKNEAGTRVRLYLRNAGNAPSCVDILRKVLGIAEFPTTAEHDGQHAQWDAHRIKERRRPGNEQDGIDVSGRRVAGPRQRSGQVIWCEYGGALLVDGIYVRSAQRHGVLADPNRTGDLRGAVVNISPDDFPRLSVDRALVVEDVSARVEALMKDATDTLIEDPSSFLEFGWIHDVAESSPWVADLVTKAATEAGFQLPVRGAKPFDTTVTGCFPLDLDLLTPDRDKFRDWERKGREVPFDPTDERFPALRLDRVPDHVVVWRLLAHRHEVLERLAEVVPDVARRLDVLPAVPSDAALLANHWSWSDDDSLGRDAPPPPGHLLWVAAGAGLSPREAAQRAALLGMREVDPAKFDPKRHLNTTDIALLSVNLDGKPPWLTTDEPVSFGHLLEAERGLRLSVAAAAERLGNFGFSIPHVERFTRRLDLPDIKLLSIELTGERPWLDHDKPVAFAHLIKASAQLGYDVAEAAERLRQFDFTVADSLPQQATTNDLTLLRDHTRWHEPWLNRDQPVSPQQLIEAAQKLNWSPRRAGERLAELGFKVRDRAQLPDQPCDDIDRGILESNGTGRDNRELEVGRPVQPVQLFWIFLALREGTIHDVAERLDCYGFHLGDDIADKCAKLTQADLLILSRDHDGQPPWLDSEENVSTAHLTMTYLKTGKSPADAVRRLDTLGFRVELPDCLRDPLTAQDLRFLSGEDGPSDWLDSREAVPLHHLIRSAHRTGIAVQDLAQRLRDLGLTVPDLAETLCDALVRVPRR